MSSKRSAKQSRKDPAAVSRSDLENALLLANMRCSGPSNSTYNSSGRSSTLDSVVCAVSRFWSELGLDARRALTSEKKHVVLQSLRKKHLHTRNCPCCQHSKVFFDGGAGTYERFCTAWENQPDDAGLIDIHSPAILGTNDTDTQKDKKKSKKKKEEGKKLASKSRPRGAKRTFLDELAERENQIREEEEERERKRELELEAERIRQSQLRRDQDEEEEEEVFVDVPTIFGDALSVKVQTCTVRSRTVQLRMVQHNAILRA